MKQSENGKSTGRPDMSKLKNILDILPALDLSDKLHPELKVHLSDENQTPVSQKLKIEENDNEYPQLNETPTVKNIHKVES